MGRKSREKRLIRQMLATGEKIERAKWTPFVEATEIRLPDGTLLPVPTDYTIYRNSRYTVFVRKVKATAPGWPDAAWLSIKRNDRDVCRDWRDFQRIKTELIGPDYEGVELYPAESRLVDGANQYHLWVPLDPRWRLPYGFDDGRQVGTDNADKSGAVQRPFTE
jgi:hypothetical protein